MRKELRKVSYKLELPLGATYYSVENRREGNRYISWTRIYDKNFNILEDVFVKYTNVLDSLTRIVKNVEASKLYLTAYDLTELNGEYSKVGINQHTRDMLVEATKQFKGGVR